MPTVFAGLLPLITLAGLLMTIAQWRAWSDAVVPTALIWTLLATASLECLSLLSAIGWLELSLFWLAASTLSIIAAWRTPKATKPVDAGHLPPSITRKIIVGSAIAIIIAALFIGFIAVPNTVDSLRYHLPRIEQWIQQGSLANFPTPDLRQLASNPLSEILILHFRLLSESDHFDNVVQGLAFAASTIVASTVARRLGGSRTAQFLAAILVVTTPMAILQGTSTQNDFVTAFFLLAAAERLLRWQKNRSYRDALACAAAVGLAFLTKGSAVFFAAPFGLIAVYQFLRKPDRKALITGITMLAVVAGINGMHLYRNAKLILTPGSLVSITAAEDKSPPAIMSSLFRNIASNFVTPFAGMNQHLTDSVAAIHVAAGIDVNAPKTTLKNTRFYDLPRNVLNGDAATNPVQVLLIIASTVLLGAALIRRDKRIPARLPPYFAAVLAGGILFCALLRWQPFIVRLQIPFFILAMPAVGVILALHMREKAATTLAIFLIVAALPFVIFNQERPLYGAPIRPFANHFAPDILSANPWQLIFWDSPQRMQAFQAAIRQVGERRFGGVGLIAYNDYPFWRALKGTHFRDPVHIENVCLPAELSKTFGYQPSLFRPAMLITDLPQPEILHCENGTFEREAAFATGDREFTVNISVYRRRDDNAVPRL